MPWLKVGLFFIFILSFIQNIKWGLNQNVKVEFKTTRRANSNCAGLSFKILSPPYFELAIHSL